jgi:transketolase
MSEALSKLDLVDACERLPWGNLVTSLTYWELLQALYLESEQGRPLLHYDVAKPQMTERDFVIFGDRQGLPAHVSILKKAGFDLPAQWDRWPTRRDPGFDVAPPLSGTALMVAVGLARALARRKAINKIFVVVGESELQSGGFWEAAAQIGFERWPSVIVLASYQRSGRMNTLQAKMESFGWKVFPLFSGHEIPRIVPAVMRAREVERQPSVVLAPTVLGHGIPFAEGKQEYRQGKLSPRELEVVRDVLSSN